MTASQPTNHVQARNDSYVARQTTKIWQETPTANNPFVAAHATCHGYDLNALIAQRSYTEVLFLLFRGELPTPEQARLLESLMIAFINPGPRHLATRAAINAGIGKTLPEHMLPIALSVMGGKHQGAGQVEVAMRTLRANMKSPASDVANTLLEGFEFPGEGDAELMPGFGSHFNSRDHLTQTIADQLSTLPGNWPAITWAQQFVAALPENLGWLPHGVAAAAFCDLGFLPRAGVGLFQLISAPGLLAHGLEYANKPITALPRISDENYVIES